MAAPVAGPALKVSWVHAGNRQELAVWDIPFLAKSPVRRSREKDPATGKLKRWEGWVLADLIVRATEPLGADDRASIDLVVLRDAAGGQALVPRWFVVKYPMLLARGAPAESVGLRAIVPWTSQPKAGQEGLPVATFFLEGVTELELGNYRERYGALFLKRRTDPAAVRGEKLFVQNCVSCHGSGRGPSVLAANLLEGRWGEILRSPGAHPGAEGIPSLGSRESRSLVSYLEAYRYESGPKATGLGEPSQSGSRLDLPAGDSG